MDMVGFPTFVLLFILTVSEKSWGTEGIDSVRFRGDIKRYLGIRYARFAGRFLAPLAVDNIHNVKYSTKLPPSCLQDQHKTQFMYSVLAANEQNKSMSEDCFFLNIYASDTAEADHPVMVWVPGEGFNFADAQQYDPSNLVAAGKVIVVTVNYRVGIFGFLTTKDTNAPANNALLDIATAFRWIRRHIHKFGGDPNKITGFGRFSGSMLLSMLITSPLFYDEDQNPLFHRLILHGGIPTGSYVFEKRPLLGFKRLIKQVNCSYVSLEDSVQCLRNISAEKLLQESNSISINWRPVLHRNSIPKDPMIAFLDGSYHKEISVILSNTNDEGSICWLTQCHRNSSYCQKMNDNEIDAEDLAKLISGEMFEYAKETIPPILLRIILNKYDIANPTRDDLRRQYLDFCADVYVNSKIIELLRHLKRYGTKVYHYIFTHRPSFSIFPKYIESASGDDILFALGQIPINSTYEEFYLQNTLMSLWSTFARHGYVNSSFFNSTY